MDLFLNVMHLKEASDAFFAPDKALHVRVFLDILAFSGTMFKQKF